jgi:hypothetical protein
MTVEKWGNIKTPEINVAIRPEMWKVIRNSVQERKNRLWRIPFCNDIKNKMLVR